MERIVFERVYNFLLENELLYKYQSGFVPGHSTTLQLIDIYHHICQAFDRNQFSCMVFLNISKAFDRVWHTGLSGKLEQYGILGDLLIWFTDYLSNRTQNPKCLFKLCTIKKKLHNSGSTSGICTWSSFIFIIREWYIWKSTKLN